VLQILILGLIQVSIALAVHSSIIAAAGAMAGLINQHPTMVWAERHVTALALTALAAHVMLS
jgi:hypothetical protein